MPTSHGICQGQTVKVLPRGVMPLSTPPWANGWATGLLPRLMQVRFLPVVPVYLSLAVLNNQGLARGKLVGYLIGFPCEGEKKSTSLC